MTATRQSNVRTGEDAPGVRLGSRRAHRPRNRLAPTSASAARGARRAPVLVGTTGTDATLLDIIRHADGWMPIEEPSRFINGGNDSSARRRPRDGTPKSSTSTCMPHRVTRQNSTLTAPPAQPKSSSPSREPTTTCSASSITTPEQSQADRIIRRCAESADRQRQVTSMAIGFRPEGQACCSAVVRIAISRHQSPSPTSRKGL